MPTLHQDTHLGLALLLVFLTTLKKDKKYWPLVLPLILLSIIATGYIWFNYEELALRQGQLLTPVQITIGCILIFLVLESTRQSFGWVLPIVALIFIAYTFWGHYLPYPLWHFPISLDLSIRQYNMGLTGMFGTHLGISANYIFLFIMYGALLQATGTIRFFEEVAKWISKKFASGPGMAAVTTSALVGMASGSGAGNVAITGAFTIPLMKKVGYKPEQAGAIEATASTGGNLMPPVMGIVAFVMAEFLGIPYLRIMVMGIIPAILYYLCIGLFVELRARKFRMKPMAGEVNYKVMRITAPLFFLPLGVLTTLLIMGYSLRFTVFNTLLVLIVLSLIRKETRGSLRTWIDGITRGVTLGVGIAVSIALIGVIMAGISLTGLGIKIPSVLETLSGGNLWIALPIVALIVIILGCGLPPFASYLLVAIMCAPFLISLGLPLLSTHYFLLFLAVSALITPPVGVCCVVATPIAGASYAKLCIEACKVGVVAWLLPFWAIFTPIIILQGGEPLLGAAKLIACLMTILLLQVSFARYFLTDLNRGELIMAILGAMVFVVFSATGIYYLLAPGLALSAILFRTQLKKKRLLATATGLTGE